MVYHFVQWSFPVLLVENLNGDYVALDGTVHVLTAYEKHGFLKTGDRDASLEPLLVAGLATEENECVDL